MRKKALGYRIRTRARTVYPHSKGAVMGNNRPSFIEVQKHLSGMDYPATRDQLVEHAKRSGAPEGIVESLRRLPAREFDGPNAVSKEMTKVS